MDIVFASNNINKVREINKILGDSFRLLSLRDIGITDDIPENEMTLEGNALVKARAVYNTSGLNVFADDTGLEVEALNGEPGVHSARYAGEAKDSGANIEKLLAALDGEMNRKARFRTIIALIFNGKEYLFEGIAEGRIINQRRGTGGFGYDPVFIPENRDITFAEMDLDEKNLISHRAMAFRKLTSFLRSHSGLPENDKS